VIHLSKVKARMKEMEGLRR